MSPRCKLGLPGGGFNDPKIILDMGKNISAIQDKDESQIVLESKSALVSPNAAISSQIRPYEGDDGSDTVFEPGKS